MIIRRHSAGEMRSEAVYSPCERYRYALSRMWRTSGGVVLFVMLNPSTATELHNDPTIERCERRSRAMGFGGMQIANLFALRATRPQDLKASRDPDGPENARILREVAAQSDMTIAAWGVHGAHLDHGRDAARSLGDLWHLGLTRDGHPRHPLYVPYAVTPAPWPQDLRYSSG